MKLDIIKTIFIPALAGLALAGVLAVSFGTNSRAASKEDWQAGNIISDQLFTDKNSMSVADIQKFLDEKINCDVWGTGKAVEFGSSLTRAEFAKRRGWQAPPYTCLNKYYEVPKTEPGGSLPANNYSTPENIPEGAKSAAWIIKDSADRYNISPKVLLVKIATESAGPLTSDNWPLFSQYRYAMGSHCPDSGPGGAANCDPNYAGFSIQMYSAAKLMRWYLDNMDKPWWSYKKPGVNFIQWNVTPRGCGGSNVNIANKATAALYTYTPYQPNEAALNNMYGTGDNCSAYGNRNFWRVYWDLFGPSRYVIRGGIYEQYVAFGGGTRLGNPTMNEYCGLKGGACFQDFQYGSIYWTPQANRAYTLIGGIHKKWNLLGKEWGKLGYPTSNEVSANGVTTQKFQNGEIRYTPNSTDAILNHFASLPTNQIGKPVGDSICKLKDGGCYHNFTEGVAYWSQKTGTQPIRGGMLKKWQTTGKEWGKLGYPITDEYTENGQPTQRFQGGKITYTSNGAVVTFNQ